MYVCVWACIINIYVPHDVKNQCALVKSKMDKMLMIQGHVI